MDGANDDKVLFAIREQQSKRRISKTIPIKDSKGNLKTITLQVEDSIYLAGTTTRERLSENNANRSLLIYLDGSKDHKEKIMAYQREVHLNRHTGEQHIETTIEDIEQANYLLKQVLLSKSDELTKACRKFLELIKSYLKYEKISSFYSEDIRIKYRMAPTTLNRYLKDLKRYGYVKIVSGSKSKGFEYELENIGEITGLEKNLQTAFDELLERIKNKYGSPTQ